ncbi:MAG: hypothetical protein COW92_01485 [Candidatus Omnitrophica bacterium CG22_combo_CG10-13_8_21_14_all_43_16]|nr:MAG: hypothetical protein COW92_01485 [Candidatus Omnitrophica bacterium CG22_combo_CG10-13_8_21_14_all_43_16]
MDKIKILLLIIASLIFIPMANASELSLHGFLQTNYSVRVNDDNPQGAKQGNLILGEERAQIRASFYPQKSKIGIFVKSDFYHDWVEENLAFDFREGYFDLAEDKFGLRVGRQIYTWGLGDLLFINDVFPKDWEAFYSGRPLEYLKIGVDSLKLDIYSNIISAEAVVMPNFQPDDLSSVGRFHFFDPYPNIPNRELEKPDSAFEKFGNMEYALRLYRYIGDFDVSAYAYKGFFRSRGMKADNFNSPSTISNFYPELAVYGLSAQRSALGGVMSAEYGYYDSLDDRSGKDSGINNSQSRFLIGYQKAFPEDFTVGVQYYSELMHQYSQYKDNLPSAFAKIKQLHQYITLRLTKLFKYQTLKLSLFTFYSPDEEDFLITPEVSYNFTDNLLGIIGMNIFTGAEDNTTFGQHKKDSDVYVTVRYSF